MLIALLFCVASAQADRAEIRLESPAVVGAGEITFAFKLWDNDLQTELGGGDLEPTYEHALHVFVQDVAMLEFRHLHPEFEGERWIATTNLPVSGGYKLWAHGQIVDGYEDFAHGVSFEVIGGTEANPAPGLKELRKGTHAESMIALSEFPLRPRKMSNIDIRFSRTDGLSPELAIFMGEKAQLIAFSEEGNHLIHTHAMDHAVPDTLTTHIVFPEAGMYRLWVEFIDRGEHRFVPVSVSVENRPTQW